MNRLTKDANSTMNTIALTDLSTDSIGSRAMRIIASSTAAVIMNPKYVFTKNIATTNIMVSSSFMRGSMRCTTEPVG